MPLPEFIVKLLRLARAAMREKPDIKSDDLEMEHLSLYHKLAGSSQENQRAEKDVRADIKEAINNRSSVSLSIALKLPPLVWQDRLERIFGEIAKTNRANAVATLAPDNADEPWPNPGDPLGHPDWRVRANAALGLAILQAEESIDRVCKALHSTASGDRLAYWAVAQALSRMQSYAGLEALRQHVMHPEPWLRVDTIGAIAHWPFRQVRIDISTALLTVNPLFDYAAVAVCETTDPLTLMSDGDPQVFSAGCQLIIGKVAAATNTFSLQLVYDLPFAEILKKLVPTLQEAPSLFGARAALSIYDLWQAEHSKDRLPINEAVTGEQIAQLRELATSQAIIERTHEVLKRQSPSQANNVELLELQHAIYLCGYLKLSESEAFLLSLAENQHPLRIEAVTALGNIGSAECAPRLIVVANKLYPLAERTGLPKSRKPVHEEDREKSRLYWTILRSLGQLPDPRSADFLIDVAEDFAPDRREQALTSLLSLASNLSSAQRSKAIEIVSRSLDDPSTMMRAAALRGVAILNAVALLDRVVRYCDSQEPSINRQAFATLSSLSMTNHQEVRKLILPKLEQESDPRRKKRYQDAMDAK